MNKKICKRQNPEDHQPLLNHIVIALKTYVLRVLRWSTAAVVATPLIEQIGGLDLRNEERR